MTARIDQRDASHRSAPWGGRALLVLLAAVCGGCENDGATIVPFGERSSDGPVSLSRDVQPIFNANCALSGCHAEPNPIIGLSLEEGKLFDPVVGAVGVVSFEAPPLLRIEPGSADTSYLVLKLENDPRIIGDPMPLGAFPLDPDLVAIIREWIDDGALDN